MSFSEKEFKQRKETAIAAVRELMNSSERRGNGNLKEVTNTGAGGIEHSRRIEQNRRHNAQVERSSALTYRNLKGVLDGVINAKTSDDLFQFLAHEVRMTVLPGKESIGKEGGGIDWVKARRFLNAGNILPQASQAMEAKFSALMLVYSKFWK